LGTAGAPGCLLYTEWLLVTAAVTDRKPRFPYGEAQARHSLPLDANLLGATLFSQWLFLDAGANPLGVTTTNGVRSTLELAMPAGGVGLVYAYSPMAASGEVITHTFPVLRLVSSGQ
jgi:hypothetical protein